MENDLNARLGEAFAAGHAQASNERNEIGAALAKAQADMANPKFDKTNPHFKNKFASLAAVRDAVIPVLSKYGIACLQDLKNVTGGVGCTTTLLHSSGQSMTFGPLEMPVSKNDAQGFGSAATYARRYHLMAVANVVGDEDDDAITGLVARAVLSDEEKAELVQREAVKGRSGRNAQLLELAQNGMRVEDLRRAFYEACDLPDTDSRRQAYFRAMKWAKSAGLIEVVEGFVLLSKTAQRDV